MQNIQKQVPLAVLLLLLFHSPPTPSGPSGDKVPVFWGEFSRGILVIGLQIGGRGVGKCVCEGG